MSFLRERGEVLPAVHLAVVLLFYGLLHSGETLLKRHITKNGNGLVSLDMVPTDVTIASFLKSYAFPPVYPFVSLSYLLILVLPQSAPSVAHLPAKAEASSSENTLVVRDGALIGTNINNKQASPLLLSDVAVFAESLEALFHQVGNHSIVKTSRSTRTRLLSIVQRSQWWPTSHPKHSSAHHWAPSTFRAQECRGCGHLLPVCGAILYR